MKIWKLMSDVDNYDNFIPEKELSADEIQSFDGRSQKANWITPKVKRMEPEKGLALGDSPGFIIPVFSKRALDILDPLIHESSEVLLLDSDEGEYYGINITAVLDAVDYSKLEYKTFSDGNRIMAFKKYAFVISPELLKHNIFKITDESTRRAFVSDRFKKMVEENGLVGFKFRLVWESDD